MPGPGGIPISVAEWRSLAPLPMAHISSEQESASVYTVVRIGFIPANTEDARAAGVAGDAPPGMLPLPTVTVAGAEGERIYRLPIELNGWAVDVVALAHAGQNFFPCDVEFGVISGRPFAEFVLEESRTD